jgi:thioredoxin reductase (NADPH)
MRKVIIVGGGPSGLTAALYTSRATLQPLVIEGDGDKQAAIGGQSVDLTPGGQLMTTTLVENFPGFPDGVNGPDLMDAMRRQAEKFGAEIVTDRVTAVDLRRRPFRVTFGDRAEEAQSVILSTGASPRHLGLPGESELTGRGVSTCATCDGAFFRNQEIAVVGGGDSALEEANFLSRFGSKVHVIHRRNEFRASKVMVERTRKNPKIELVLESVPARILGVEKNKLAGLEVEHVKTKARRTLGVGGLFVAIGHEPNTALFKGQVELDPQGYVLWKADSMTSVEGVFACGDCVDHRYRQAITASAMGCMAAIDVERWLEARGI